MYQQTEHEAIANVTAICKDHLDSFDIVVVKRTPKTHTSYIAQIGVLSREGAFDNEILFDIFKNIIQSPSCLFSFGGTQRDIKDLSFEELYIDAEITPIQ